MIAGACRELEQELSELQSAATQVGTRLNNNNHLTLTAAVRRVMAPDNGGVAGPEEKPAFDFFVAYAGPDEQLARSLYRRLVPSARAFLAAESLSPGDNWDVELPKAQSQSRITIALLSLSTREAYYQREEIAAAINQSRLGKTLHRVVPVYLPGFDSQDSMPYGLRRTHGIWWKAADDVKWVASQLLALRDAIRQ